MSMSCLLPVSDLFNMKVIGAMGVSHTLVYISFGSFIMF